MLGALLAIRGVRATYERLNRRDLDGFLAAWSDDATFEFPGDVWASGRFAGKAEVRGWFERFLATFPELRFTLESVAVARPAAMGAANDLTACWTIDLRNRDGVGNRNSGVTAIALRGGRVSSAKDFLFDTGASFRRVWGESAPAEASSR